jgi:hypothetical protein
MKNILDKLLEDEMYLKLINGLPPGEKEKILEHINKTLRPIVDNFSNLSEAIQNDPKKREDLLNSLKKKDT